ncbi:hypothetical protein [Maricaulis sp.]|uniref:hypothetical protein n=1 Tax=Maricaulis sp. TaxID=1486257 RepID=UPI003A8EF9DE
MSSSSRIPARLAVLNLITYIAMLGSGVVLLLLPAVSGLLSIHPYAAAPVAVLLAINVMVLGVCAAALQFKAGPAWWCVYIVSAANVAVWLTVALDLALIWQVVEQQRWDRAWLAGLFLPAACLSWVGLVLSGDPKPVIDAEAVIDATLHPEPEAVEPAAPPLLKRLVKLLGYGVRLAVLAICVVQLFILAAGLIFAVYAVMSAILFNDQVISPRQMGATLAAVRDAFLQRYTQAALPIAKTTLIYVAGFIALVVTIVPVTIAIGAGFNAVNGKREALPQAKRAWVESSAREMMHWLSGRPRKPWGGLIVVPVLMVIFLLGPAMLSVPSWWLAEWINGVLFPPQIEFFRERPGGFGIAAGGIAGFCAFGLLAIAGTQLLPGLKDYWASMNRKRAELQPALMLQEALGALDSAARKGWYSMTEPFDPEAFLHRWLRRSVNAANRILLVSLPVILALTIVDALWFRSWGEAGLRQSGPFEFVVHNRAYADASRVETSCSLHQDEDNGPQARADYVIVFAEGRRFSLRRRLNPPHLERLERIDQALRAAGVPVVELTGSDQDGEDRAACYARLRGQYAGDGARLVEILTGTEI